GSGRRVSARAQLQGARGADGASLAFALAGRPRFRLAARVKWHEEPRDEGGLSTMAAPETLSFDPADVQADLPEVIRQTAAFGRVRDPELLRRITERAAKVRQEILEKHGALNIAVDLIREGREKD